MIVSFFNDFTDFLNAIDNGSLLNIFVVDIKLPNCLHIFLDRQSTKH